MLFFWLEQNLDKIYWDHLSCNPNAICLLEQNPDKIDWFKVDWFVLSKNPKAISFDRAKFR